MQEERLKDRQKGGRQSRKKRGGREKKEWDEVTYKKNLLHYLYKIKISQKDSSKRRQIYVVGL